MDRLIVCVLAAITLTVVRGQSPTVHIKGSEPKAYEGIIEVEQSKDVTMNCYVENVPKYSLVRWQKTYITNNGRLGLLKVSTDKSVEDNTKMSIEKPSYSTWRLRIKSVGRHDSGNYSCFVMTTRQNRRESNMAVHVLVPPTLDPEYTSSDTIVRKGDDIDLLCNARGYPPPTIEWSRLGGALLPIGKEKHFQPRMSIIGVMPEDRGKYRCRVYNTIGKVSRDITLDVRFKPEISAQHRVLYQAPGYMIELQCLVIANPFPRELMWFKGKRSLSPSSYKKRYKIQAVEGAFNQMSYELVFKSVQESDYGEYMCQVKNTEGTGRQRIELKRSATPQPSIKLGRIISSSSTLYVSVATIAMCVAAILLQ